VDSTQATDETYKQAMTCLQHVASFRRSPAETDKKLYVPFDSKRLEDAQAAGENAINQPADSPIVWELANLEVGGKPPHHRCGASAKCQMGLCFRWAANLLADLDQENFISPADALDQYNLIGLEQSQARRLFGSRLLGPNDPSAPAASPVNDKEVGRLLHLCGDGTGLQILSIARDQSKSVNDRLYALVEIDRRLEGYNSEELADLCDVKGPAVRQTAFWITRKDRRDKT
jgi:hypothetical protein